MPEALTSADLSTLAASLITPALAKRARLYRVNREEGAELVGRKAYREDCSGIVFPIIRPQDGAHIGDTLRRDNPEIVYERGKPKTKQKYLNPPGAANRLYFAPGTPAALLQDTSVPLVITEGAKKTLALETLSRHGQSEAADKPRFLAVGLSGVWNWRGTIGKETGANGGRQDVKGPIPDLDSIAWSDRAVIICFDSDAEYNPMIQAAEHQLAAELHFRAAKPSIARIPQRTDDKLGIDDFAHQYGAVEALKIITEAKPDEPKDPSNADKQTALITKILAGVDFFKNPDGKLYATIPVNMHRETVNIKTARFRSWMTGSYYRIARAVPSSQRVQEALQLCEFRAEHDGITQAVHFRVAGHDGRVYIDLADEDWHAVEIDADGWRIVTNPPVRFRRSPGMLALPWPVPNGKLSELREFMNAEEDEVWISMLSWLIGSFNPKGPYPILLLQGEQGTAKSTQARVLRSVIDPASAPARSMPREERDLVIAAFNGWVMSYDNLSGLPHWLSDALCRIATGGGFATRQLHTDAEEIVFNSTRPTILNGIDDIAKNGDLADRAVTVNLPVIEPTRRRPEEAFWLEFEAAHGRILGSVLTAVSGAIRGRATVTLSKLPRMADFALWVAGAASVGALPFTQEEFEAVYFEQATAATAVILESSPVGHALRRLMSDRARWEGSPTGLQDILNLITDDDVKRSKEWPKNAAWLSKALKRLAPVMRAHGLDITNTKAGKDRTRLVQITHCEITADGRIVKQHVTASLFDS